MLAMIELHYSAYEIIRNLPRDKWLRLRERVSQLNLDDWPEAQEKHPGFYQHGLVLVDLTTDGPALTEIGVSFEVKRFKGTYRVQGEGEGGIVHNLNIAIPNIGLLAIEEVKVLEDECTDILQDHLDEGWRIVAVCPPNSVRRPDYILGRSRAERKQGYPR